MNTSPANLIILAHPSPKSLRASLAQAYARGCNGQVLSLNELDFVWNLDPREVPALEPELVRAQALIKEAKHITWVYPCWWGSAPACLKAFVDRTFITGYAYRYKPNGMPEGLLKGKTSRILLTMDSPSWWHALVYRKSALTWLRWATLWFSGIKVLQPKLFAGVRKASPEQIQRWLAEASSLGKQDAR